MAKEREVSSGGSEIHRHESVQSDFELAHGNEDTIDAVTAHFAAHIGPPDNVFHEIISEFVHLDVHIINPTGGRGCWTLFTTGMSDLPMNTPEGAEDLTHAELMVTLPESWPIGEAVMEEDRWDWPVRILKFLARLPHQFDTWLGAGHTIPNGDPWEPYDPSTKLCCALILPTLRMQEEASTISVPDGRNVNVYAVHFLHESEMKVKLERGTDHLIDLFAARGLSEVLDPDRPPVTKRRKRFGLF